MRPHKANAAVVSDVFPHLTFLVLLENAYFYPREKGKRHFLLSLCHSDAVLLMGKEYALLSYGALYRRWQGFKHYFEKKVFACNIHITLVFLYRSLNFTLRSQ